MIISYATATPSSRTVMAGVTSTKEIFLSYSRDDTIKPFVASLKHDLEQNGFSVWLDIEDIPDGMLNISSFQME